MFPARAEPSDARQPITGRLRNALEDVVWRYRVALRGVDHCDVRARTLTGERAHQLAVTRSWRTDPSEPGPAEELRPPG